MNPTIRQATAADAAAICAIYNPYVLDTTISFETHAVSVTDMAQRIEVVAAQLTWLVHEEQGRVRGYAYATQWKARQAYRYSLESSIYLARNEGGKGGGSRLYSALLSELQKRSVHAVMAGIALRNDGSVACHEKMGFVNVGRFSQVGRKCDQWIDVGYWQLIL